jgi:hypothetical protein
MTPPQLSESLATLQRATDPGKLPAALDALEKAQASLRRSSFDVAAKAAELGPDVDSAFRFVRDQVRFEVYEGVLRGARGALMARAGNAFDKSILLGELLRRHRIEVRFKTATLPRERAEALVAQMYNTVPSVDDGRLAASRATASEELVAAARDVANAVSARFVTHL